MTKTHPMTELTAGSEIDESTSDAIFDWFQFRRVCHNDRFPTYFARQLKLVDHQYQEMLRLELTTWDPMIADYMERQITRAAEDTTSGSSNSKTTNDLTTSKSTTYSGTDTQTTDRTQNQSGQTGNTRTNDLKSETTNNLTVTQDGTTSTSGEGTSTDAGSVTNKGTESSNNASGARVLDGTTPDSATYTQPAPSQPIPGMPTQLSWAYASAQRQSDGAETHAGENESTETRDLNGSTTSRSEGSDHSTTTTTGGTTRDDTGTVTDAGTSSSELTGKDVTTLERGQRAEESGTSGGTVSVEGTTSGSNKRDEDTRERYSGRHEAPPELLKRAWDYLYGSNSLKWLLAQLETCFFQIFDDEEDYDYGF